MPRNGSGTYSRTDGTRTGSDVFAQQLAASQAPTAALLDAEAQDMADAITASLAKDGQTTPTANLPMGTYKHTNVGAASARTDYARASQVQDNAFAYAGTTGGSSNAYTATLSPAPTVLTAGMLIWCQANHTNTSAATLNLNSIGATAIRSWANTATALRAGAIQQNMFMWLLYDGTNWRLLNSRESDAAQYARYEPETATSDGADSGSARIQGFAGTTAQNRGAYGIFYGNEGSATGVADISAGSVSGAYVSLDSPGSDGEIRLKTNGSQRWAVESDGDLANNGSNGGNLVFNKAGTGPILGVNAAVSAAGSDLAGATELTALVSLVTGGTASQGVKLPSSAVIGSAWKVQNATSGAVTIKLYPPSGGNFANLTTDTSVDLAVGDVRTLIKMSSTVWLLGY